MRTKSEVITLDSGRKINNFILQNDKGMQVEILSLGGTLRRVLVPDAEGNFENVVLGWKDLNLYEVHPGNFGAIVGRVAGRIYKGIATINGKEYHFTVNESGNTLHGGRCGFHLKDWEGILSEEEDKVSVTLKYLSRDGEEGFPGNVEASVTYALNNQNELSLNYEAVTDQETLVNLTNHAYFNLSGDGRRAVYDEELMIDSDAIYELDEQLIPTGKMIDLNEETYFDFRKPKKIGQDINKEDAQLKHGLGYDHIWKLNQGSKAVSLYDSVSKRYMTVTTSEPGVVVYTMNHADEPYVLENGNPQSIRYGVCFETQKPAIGYGEVNKQAIILKPKEIYKQQTTFSFSIK